MHILAHVYLYKDVYIGMTRTFCSPVCFRSRGPLPSLLSRSMLCRLLVRSGLRILVGCPMLAYVSCFVRLACNELSKAFRIAEAEFAPNKDLWELIAPSKIFAVLGPYTP